MFVLNTVAIQSQQRVAASQVAANSWVTARYELAENALINPLKYIFF